ncbi:hypothetical protein ACQY0O_005234 [Thecaphora frezii]|nr:putative chitinase 3 [Thecaphora frezii]
MKLLPLAIAAFATVATTTTAATPDFDNAGVRLYGETFAVAGPSNPSPSPSTLARAAIDADEPHVAPSFRRRREATDPPSSKGSSAILWDSPGGRKRRAVRSEPLGNEQRSWSTSKNNEGPAGKGKGKAKEPAVSAGRKGKRTNAQAVADALTNWLGPVLGTIPNNDNDNAKASANATATPSSSSPAPKETTDATVARQGNCTAAAKGDPSSAQPGNSTAAGTLGNATVGSSSKTVGTGKVMAGYWPDWTSSSLPPEKIDFTKFDFINYAFALPTRDFNLDFPTDNTRGLLRRLVKAAHAGGTKVVLSIGGWGGSTYFSPAVRTSLSRSRFIGNIRKVYTQFGLDGIDLDWEYPGQGNSGNQYSPQDTANFQTFLQELRRALPEGAIISAAVAHDPWTASSGRPVSNVQRAAGALDFVLIMNYDVWGSSETPGANAPLADLCGNSSQPRANAAAGVRQWAAAGMPREKILLGIPSYGYLNGSNKRRLKARSDNPMRARMLAIRDANPVSRRRTTPAGYVASKPDRDDAEQESGWANEQQSDVPSGKVGRYDARRLPSSFSSTSSSSTSKRGVTLTSSDGSSSSGQINFNKLVEQGALRKDASTGLFVGAGGFEKYWDDCSDTPYLADGRTVVTYDDTSSLWDKGAFAVQAGIGGLNLWSIDGDTKGWDLVNSALAGMVQGGIEEQKSKNRV